MEQGTGVAAAVRGCRVVTTSMTARLLLAEQLRALDDVSWSVVSGDAFDDAPRGLSVEVVPIRREFAPSDVLSFVRLLRYFRRQRFDFVQTHTPKASFLGLWAARLAGTTAIYTVHGALYFRDNGWRANVLGWLFERWCCGWANLVLVQSREDEGVLPRARVCRAAKIRYIGNGVVLERFTEPVEPWRRSSRPVVVMVSRLVKEKGCVDYLELARALAGRAEFVHVGPVEPDQRDGLSAREMAAASGSVSFVGAVDDIRPYLAAADLVVLPSYREGIPRVAMEAAAAGCAVVAYDVRGMREVIDPASGLLVPRGDRAALVSVVASLLDDPGRRARLAEQCRARVLAQFSEDAVIERLRGVYRELGAAA
ncbi:MAG TPA: glycosyltransferase [Acidimicrobiales bacterium]|nr:glycosyltransferase [Acidimicrobiales bacterium]